MFPFDTVWPADAAEFCPTEGYRDIFVCGTYKLLDEPSNPSNEEKKPQERRGQCLVFRTGCDAETALTCEKIQTIDRPAIPDMKWEPASKEPLLAIADSEGGVNLYGWDEDRLSERQSIACGDKAILSLSLDWSNKRLRGSGSLVVSMSNGTIVLLTPQDGNSLGVTEQWHAHDYEPWVAAWNYWTPDFIYTGGDDLKLKGWDIRQGFDQPAFVNKRFEAGVTCIQSHPQIEHLIAVGSYDNSVRLFDVRKPLVPLVNVDVGGGAWRVKWHPSDERKQDLLVACMHDGFRVVRFNGDITGPGFSGETEIIKSFTEHESLAYGADWSHAEFHGKESMVGTCSFYDHKMCLWTA